MKINLRKIYPIVPTNDYANELEQRISKGRISRPSDWKNNANPSENVVENVIMESLVDNFSDAYMQDNGEKINPQFIHSKQAFNTFTSNPSNIMDYYNEKKNKDMWYAFLDDRMQGCYAFVKVPDPTKSGKGVHIGVRYYDPQTKSYHVYPKEKKGQADSHFWTEYINRSGSQWKQKMEKEIINGFAECHQRYGFGETPEFQVNTSESGTILWEGSGNYGNNRRTGGKSCYTNTQYGIKTPCKSVLVDDFDGLGKSFLALPKDSVDENAYNNIKKGKELSGKLGQFTCAQSRDRYGKIINNCYPKTDNVDIEIL